MNEYELALLAIATALTTSFVKMGGDHRILSQELAGQEAFFKALGKQQAEAAIALFRRPLLALGDAAPASHPMNE
jgi:hypothetical protein